MSASDPLHALATGTRVVTPNNRLARALSARHDAAMVRSGKTGWTAGRVLPWDTWLGQLWQEAIDGGVATRRRLAPIEASYLWRRIIDDDPAMPDAIIDSGGLADLAGEAWTLVHAWGVSGWSWRAWRDSAQAPAGSDVHAFTRWAERYRRELDAREACDDAMLADALAGCAESMRGWRGERVLLAGFLELTPQQERLCTALRTAGMEVVRAAEPDAPVRVQQVVAATVRDEVVLALRWAREHALRTPEATIGIAINGLAARRDEVRALAEDILCPALQLPGHVEAGRPYDLSLGAPLGEAPIVAAALGWLGLAHGRLDRAAAAALFRSPYGPGRWVARAALERTWLEAGRVDIFRDEAARALTRVDAAAGAKLAAALAASDLSRPHTAREWVARWRAFLGGCGWPGEAPLAGAAYEGREALARMLDDFVRLDALGMRLAPGEALALLRDQAAARVFQPQGGGGPVLLLGLLEAASLHFDALWVAGLSGQEWPPAPRPNPLLPLAWQRERGVPRSSAARECAFATRVTERLRAGAPDVVLSAPAVLANATVRPTALVTGPWPTSLAAPGDDTAHQLATAGVLESIVDGRAPALGPGPARGGVGAIAAQADCPFMATAQYRLRADPWPIPTAGLSHLERGQIVHALMASFWHAVGSHAGLLALTASGLRDHLDAAAAMALRVVPPARWEALPPVLAAVERERLPSLAAEWIETVERPRPDFRVERIEARGSIELANLVFSVALDRVDALVDGSVAIVDYKTGNVDSPKTWFADRPRSPQLGVYLLALRGEAPPVPVRAVAYGCLKPGAIGVAGYAADHAQWPALSDAARSEDPAGWAGIEAFFATQLPIIAAEIRDGIATVTPRPAPNEPCRRCARQALCRITAARGFGWAPGEALDE